MKKLIAGIGIATFSTLLSAQQAFDGWFGQVGVGAANANSTENINIDAYTFGTYANRSFNYKKTNVAGNISIGYSKSFDSFNLALNGFYNFSSSNYGTAPNDAESGIVRQANIKNVYGISLEPGYYFDKKLLAYAKLGAAWADMSVSFQNCEGCDSDNFGSSIGFLYGLGAKYELAKNWYAGAEIYQIAFSTKSFSTDFGFARNNNSFKTTYNYAGLVIGYKF